VRRVKIVATLGPATDGHEVDLVRAGLDVARLADDLETNIDAMEAYLMEHESAAPADTVVITGSHPFEPGVHTNFVKFHVLTRQPG
jgi:pyruvate kinase